MKKPEDIYDPHLKIREFSLAPGTEWEPRFPGWALIQVAEGTGYYLHASFNRELQTGALLILAEGGLGSIRASQLGRLALNVFNVVPARLAGLATLGEQRFFESAATAKEWKEQVFPPEHFLALAMRELCGEQNQGGLLSRLKLLELFVKSFGVEFVQPTTASKPVDSRKRLHDFLEQTSSLKLLEVNFGELAQMTHCTPRHLSRIFRDEMGMSFRDKRAELRLARARELLATTDSKIVDVALESGYKSLSLFNLMFARHFGLSPARWRIKNGKNPGYKPRADKGSRRRVQLDAVIKTDEVVFRSDESAIESEAENGELVV